MITNYFYKDNDQAGWSIGPCQFGHMNLLVGESGSGKTRCLNSIFNIANFVKGDPNIFCNGTWELFLEIDDVKYSWTCTASDENGEKTILNEKLCVVDESDPASTKVLVERNKDRFVFSGNLLPKLSRDRTSITLLKEEDSIKNIYYFFTHLYRRSFQNEDLQHMGSLGLMANIHYENFSGEKGKERIGSANFPINLRMKILFNAQKELYQIATNIYKTIFPKIVDFSFEDQRFLGGPLEAQVAPIFRIHELGVAQPISYGEISSGMQKVLGIITDILILPKGSLYLIDEYENSLGINAIDFLPEFLEDYGDGAQFIVTTHHPYLINNMPLTTWRLFKRVGSNVKIKNGSELEDKYGKSKQNLFTQLINDPDYSDENC